MDTSRFVPLKTFDNDLEAEAAKQHLQSHGIQALITKDDSGGMYPWLQQRQGVLLQVFEADLARAEKVMKAMKA